VRRPRFYRDLPLSETPVSSVDTEFVEIHETEDLGDSSWVRNTGIPDSRIPGTYGFSGSLAARTRDAGGRAGFSASRPATGQKLEDFLATVAGQKETRPVGDWRRGFQTVRELRSHPELRHLREDPDGALEAVEAVAPEGWFEETFGPEDPHLVFLHQWSKVRLDLDDDPLEKAIQAAKEDPAPFPGRLSPIIRLIGSVAAHRSLLAETFALPQPQLAEMTGILQGTICKAIQELTRRGILRPEGEKGRAKLYSYHGPLPKIENKPAPILPAPETAKEPEPVQTPREPEERLPKWSRAQVDAAWKGWDPDQRKLYREVYDRNKPGEAFEGEAASLAMDAVLGAKGEPEEEDIILPQKGKPFRVSRDYLEELRTKHPTLNVREEIRKLSQKIEDTGEEIGRMRLYLEKWLQNAERDAPRWKMCREVQPGDPVDGAYNDDRTKRWSSFNRSWTEAKNWTPRDEMLRVYTDLMSEAYG
jgi:hypothetical protein